MTENLIILLLILGAAGTGIGAAQYDIKYKSQFGIIYGLVLFTPIAVLLIKLLPQ